VSLRDDALPASGLRSEGMGKMSVQLPALSTAGAHVFLRMPSCQINFSIDGLALGVAMAIVERA
jgi:hypothetical protein